jgi:uncharacterized protein YcgI (DUF1989 family)
MTLYRHDIPGGSAWSTPVRAGRLITLTALGHGANLSVLLIGSDRLDRLNVPDTLKAQMSACIRVPMVLMSDRGLALASVVESSLDWHDALTGFAQDQSRNDMNGNGTKSTGTNRSGPHRSGPNRSDLIIELDKHGLGDADLHGCVNFFSKVAIDERARLRFVPGHAQAGDTVSLRTEQDLLMIAAATAHPMNDTDVDTSAGVRVAVAVAAPPAPNDEPAQFRPESARALEQTKRVFA